MKIIKQERMVVVPMRIPPAMREKARQIANQRGVRESAVYRAIIADFFSSNRQLKVDESSTQE